eukprot:1160548-Pelagomonas_calceolata.AAC.7
MPAKQHWELRALFLPVRALYFLAPALGSKRLGIDGVFLSTVCMPPLGCRVGMFLSGVHAYAQAAPCGP